ncbi:MAG: isochorismate synthase [candidate division Zixibacteria bacterium]|nr:isochorismate synthase [candidate division Zixibacteria bacterium]
MTSISQQTISSDMTAAYGEMAEQLRAMLVSQPRRAESDAIRLTVRVNDINPLQWLKAQAVCPRMYWSDRLGMAEIAGCGIAHRLDGRLPKRSDLLIVGSSDMRYYGGMRFDGQATRGARWSDFGAASFVIPRFELVRCHGETDFVCNLVGMESSVDLDGIIRQLEKLTTTIDQDISSMPHLLERLDAPAQTEWETRISQVLDDLHGGVLRKIVLARRIELQFDREIDPLSMLQRLDTPGCYRFFWESSPGMAFVSISPERLYRRDGRHIECEALAGTRPRGKTVAEDNRLGRELLGSDKDGREHSFVTEAIREALSMICDKVRGGNDITIMKLPRLQHLLASFKGKLRDGVSNREILDFLHPTPAVAGYPIDQACDRLTTLESFDRGWYSGPVGWLGSGDRAEFAVAIRSALAQGKRLTLYAGAGIVEGSDPKQEWDESENKMSQFLALFS